jgi:hypothetical protein
VAQIVDAQVLDASSGERGFQGLRSAVGVRG